ncbi:hypothetical protein NQ315_014768 [Exocentrus adspersus]|uniref:DDE Tnp4 domain-containing protein n=1 Tax=Exocentrus adspersus TaxID=1586481 RepID=A0AAV8VMX7_9CUCU|nr:hypothetical protein NQ315_014768 [Exocentrus adspersus]
MPNRQEQIHIQSRFYNISRFPRVIGCIDGTHIKIQNPGTGQDDGEVFRNRKGYFSLNIQVVCNADLKIMDIVARWPGSTHDMTIFNNSMIRARFEARQFENSFLLGDSGYALKSYLLTPLLNPIRPEEIRYNEAHIRTRNSVERTFGVWKRRFPVLAYGLRCKLENALTTIVATAVLHNIARRQNEREPPPPEYINFEQLQYLIGQGDIQPEAGHRVNEDRIIHDNRRNLITNYFANL